MLFTVASTSVHTVADDAGFGIRDGGNNQHFSRPMPPVECSPMTPSVMRVDTFYVETGVDAVGGVRRGGGSNSGRLSEIHVRHNIKVSKNKVSSQ